MATPILLTAYSISIASMHFVGFAFMNVLEMNCIVSAVGERDRELYKSLSRYGSYLNRINLDKHDCIERYISPDNVH